MSFPGPSVGLNIFQDWSPQLWFFWSLGSSALQRGTLAGREGLSESGQFQDFPEVELFTFLY